MSDSFSAMPVRQISVDAVIWRARPCEGHDAYSATCPLCVEGTHCADHEAFDAECAECRECKTPEDLGTIDHYHEDPAQQAGSDELRKGVRFWRR